MTATHYIWILAQQAPFEAGLDLNSRTVFSCNYVVEALGPIIDLKNEILKLLSDAGLGTRFNGATGDTFVGRNAKLPPGDGPYVTLIPTAGFATRETHNGARYERPGFQIWVTATVYSAAETRANAIWRLLDGVRDTDVTGLS